MTIENQMLVETQLNCENFNLEKANQPILPRSPLFSSHQLTWEGINAQYHQQPAWEIPATSSPYHVIAVNQVKQTIQSNLDFNGQKQSQKLANMDIAILPSNVSYKASWEREIEFILLFLEPSFVARIAYESVDPDRVEILPHFPTPDPLIYQIALLFRSEIESKEPSSYLYIDSLATTLAVTLLKRYSAKKTVIKNYSGGISKRKLKQVIEYINVHLAEDLSLSKIAAQIQISPYYFARLFKQSTGQTLHQYVTQRRIDRAKQLLRDRDTRIINIAEQVGFESQSHFNKVFRKYTGMNPKSYRDTKN